MKTYTLTETFMNGTVTMDIITTLYRAKSFEEVVKYIANNLGELKKVKIIFEENNDEVFSYSIHWQHFPVFGCITNEEQEVIEIQ